MFLVAEWRQSDPMLDLNLFRRPAVIGSSIVAVALSASIFALFLYITLYVQDDLGYGPFAAGLRFLPITMLVVLRRALRREAQRPHQGPVPARQRAA